MHDVLDPRDIVLDELHQLESSGFVVEDLKDRVLAAVTAGDVERLGALHEQLRLAPRDPAWSYTEPANADDIAAALEPAPAVAPWTGEEAELRDRLHGAWLGRCVSCAMGKPVEGLPRAAIRAYLEAARAWPLRDFVPLLDPLPPGVDRLHESARVSARGCFDCGPRDDDTDYTVLGLHLMETYGRALTAADVAREWLDRLPFTQVYTAERAAYRNLVRNVAPADAARVDNPYREWIGALIRADMFGYVSPGDPVTAVHLAIQDASLSHTANGVYGEMWAAALIAAAFTAADLRAALEVARAFVPPRTRMREAQDLVLDAHAAGADWDQLVARLDALVGHYDWVHSINNAAGIAAALLWGAGDLPTSVGRVVGLGWDTDSDAATVGSVLGAMHGTRVVPSHLAAPLGDRLRSAIRDFDRSSISGLADRSLVLALEYSRTGFEG